MKLLNSKFSGKDPMSNKIKTPINKSKILSNNDLSLISLTRTLNNSTTVNCLNNSSNGIIGKRNSTFFTEINEDNKKTSSKNFITNEINISTFIKNTKISKKKLKVIFKEEKDLVEIVNIESHKKYHKIEIDAEMQKDIKKLKDLKEAKKESLKVMNLLNNQAAKERGKQKKENKIKMNNDKACVCLVF